ncbi:MAG: SDR family NAD(P)-dependent oxidoreductase [bacterium]|nr:SDR family NAD(P)-dependent oxidoreductase [bacterium]
MDSSRIEAVVTGAGSGIGLAVGRRLVREGFTVLGVDRDEDGLDRAAAAGMRVLRADLSEASDRDSVVERASGCRFLVNAAGIILLKPITEVTVVDLERVYLVNVHAVWDLTSRIGARMAPGSAIVNLSSSSAKLATTTEAAGYASSKAAVLSLTRSFAYAFASGNVRVNAICPGIIDTPMQDAVLAKVAIAREVDVADLARERNAVVPLKRAASADECAGAIWFLLSDEAAYMTGQAVNFTGGLVMH